MRINYEDPPSLITLSQPGCVLSITGGVPAVWPSASEFLANGQPKVEEGDEASWASTSLAPYPKSPLVVRTTTGVNVISPERDATNFKYVNVYSVNEFANSDNELALEIASSPVIELNWYELLRIKHTKPIIVPGGFVLFDQTRGAFLHVDFSTDRLFHSYDGTVYFFNSVEAPSAEADAWANKSIRALWGDPGFAVFTRPSGDTPLMGFARFGVAGRPFRIPADPVATEVGDELWIFMQTEEDKFFTCFKRAGTTGPFVPISFHYINAGLEGMQVLAIHDTANAVVVVAANPDTSELMVVEYASSLMSAFKPDDSTQEYTVPSGVQIPIDPALCGEAENFAPLVTLVETTDGWFLNTPGGVFVRSADASVKFVLSVAGTGFLPERLTLTEPGSLISASVVNENPILIQQVENEMLKSRLLILSPDFSTVLYERVYPDFMFDVFYVPEPGPMSEPVFLGRTSDPPLGYGPDGEP